LKQYLDTVREVLESGTRKENRTGVDTLSTFNINYEIDLADGFPLLTTKEISWKNIVVENLWFLSGDTDIGLLRKHGCRFWDPWADDDGRVPSAYGNFWRHFPVHDADGRAAFNDQVAWVVQQLRENPMSRRMVVSAWAPGNAQTSALPPCHAFWVVNVQLDADGEPRVCLHLTQRSCDVALGVPYNIAGYSLLLSLFAHLSGMRPGIFAHTLVDAHVYTAKPDGSMAEYDHVPGLREQLTRTPGPLPRLTIDPAIRELDDILPLLRADTDAMLEAFRLDHYAPWPALQFKVAV
jgi:thymidylate synthase